jgi:hypothetical protein
MNTFSLNNRLVVESYKKEGLKTTVNNGFAMVSQKVAVKGLTVLMDAKFEDGTFIPKGSIAYIREELLHTQAWAAKPLECAFLDTQFLIVDKQHVDFIAPPPEKPAA